MSRLPGLRLLRPDAGRVPEPEQYGLVAVRQMGRSSFVATCGGVAKSSAPPMRSVSTFDVLTRLYSSSAGVAGQVSANLPPPQMKSVPG